MQKVLKMHKYILWSDSKANRNNTDTYLCAHFSWLYGNSGAFLLVVCHIPADHVDNCTTAARQILDFFSSAPSFNALPWQRTVDFERGTSLQRWTWPPVCVCVLSRATGQVTQVSFAWIIPLPPFPRSLCFLHEDGPGEGRSESTESPLCGLPLGFGFSGFLPRTRQNGKEPK